MIQIIELSKV